MEFLIMEFSLACLLEWRLVGAQSLLDVAEKTEN
jgi:hypothetical protein